MAAPMKFDIPHSLGFAEAKRRIEAGMPKLEKHIPGGGTVTSAWTSDREMRMTVAAMGQNVDVDMIVEEDVVRATVAVPLLLAMMAGPIKDFVRSSAGKMLAAPAAK